MAILAGFDVHRAQITFDALNTETGEVLRGRFRADRDAVGAWMAQFSGEHVEVAVQACTGWLFVYEALTGAGVVVHLAEPAEASALRGRKRPAKTERGRALAAELGGWTTTPPSRPGSTPARGPHDHGRPRDDLRRVRGRRGYLAAVLGGPLVSVISSGYSCDIPAAEPRAPPSRPIARNVGHRGQAATLTIGNARAAGLRGPRRDARRRRSAGSLRRWRTAASAQRFSRSSTTGGSIGGELRHASVTGRRVARGWSDSTM